MFKIDLEILQQDGKIDIDDLIVNVFNQYIRGFGKDSSITEYAKELLKILEKNLPHVFYKKDLSKKDFSSPVEMNYLFKSVFSDSENMDVKRKEFLLQQISRQAGEFDDEQINALKHNQIEYYKAKFGKTVESNTILCDVYEDLMQVIYKWEPKVEPIDNKVLQNEFNDFFLGLRSNIIGELNACKNLLLSEEKLGDVRKEIIKDIENVKKDPNDVFAMSIKEKVLEILQELQNNQEPRIVADNSLENGIII